MEIDSTTLHDLSVFHQEYEYSLMHKLDFTQSSIGKAELQRILSHPCSDTNQILEMQNLLRCFEGKLDKWPTRISNGTLLIIEKFLDDNPDEMPTHPSVLSAFLYKWIHPTDYAMITFSVHQLFEFIKGLDEIVHFFLNSSTPNRLRYVLDETAKILANPELKSLKQKHTSGDLNSIDILRYGRLFHVEIISEVRKLIDLYSKFDAWHSMAMANHRFALSFPIFHQAAEPVIEAKGLFHMLIEGPVAYDLTMHKQSNFIFLTGANMAGKSTLIKSVGLAVYLAHIGMGVPAASMKLTPFEGILTNINVVDNIAKGESYFFNEVRRIRETIERISNGKRWLVLIDELFKGTNIQDAMKCSEAVIRGLIRMENALFILSTHLYEIGDQLKGIQSICFKYFETQLINNELLFSYQLKDGISQDRMGYLILQKEGVTSLLDQLGGKTSSNHQ
jgi:DNA mismatch repair protein MutS